MAGRIGALLGGCITPRRTGTPSTAAPSTIPATCSPHTNRSRAAIGRSPAIVATSCAICSSGWVSQSATAIAPWL